MGVDRRAGRRQSDDQTGTALCVTPLVISQLARPTVRNRVANSAPPCPKRPAPALPKRVHLASSGTTPGMGPF
jgi:hypothetical protein